MLFLHTAGGPIHHSSDHYYSPPHGPKEERTWSPHMESYELMVGVVSLAINKNCLELFHLTKPKKFGKVIIFKY